MESNGQDFHRTKLNELRITPRLGTFQTGFRAMDFKYGIWFTPRGEMKYCLLTTARLNNSEYM